MAELVCVYDLAPMPRTMQDTLPALDPGDTTQIEAITAEATRRNVEVTILVDQLHVAGYISKLTTAQQTHHRAAQVRARGRHLP